MPPSIATPPRPSRYRWIICALLFWVTTANYIDRSVFGNLAPELKATIGWTDQQYWNMQIAFSGAYAISMLLMGRLMDLVGLRWGFMLACAFWGLASMSHALATTVTGFLVCRVLLGLGEGGNFPAAIKTVAEWFPKHERALATGIFNSGSNVGGILVPFALPAIVTLIVVGVHFGWRGAFLATGLVDLCWIAAWLTLYGKPEEHPRVNQEELALIQGDSVEAPVKVRWSTLFSHRQMWAFAVAKVMTDCFWWFYLFGSPDFFNKKFDLDPQGRKYVIMMIYALASVGSIAGGWLAGRFMKAGWSTNKARKITLLICAVVVVPVFYAAVTENKWTAAMLIMLAASAHQAWSANVFSLAGDMFPKRVVGSVTGLGGMIGALGGMGLFYVTGKVLKETGDYLPIFVMASAAYALALMIVHLIVPRLERARIDATAIK